MPVYKDGKTWRTSFYCNKKKKNKRGFTNKKEALNYEREYILKYNGSSDMLFSSLVELYLEDAKKTLKINTIVAKENILKKHFLPYFKNYKISEITNKLVKNFLREHFNNSLKLSTIKKAFSDFKSVFNFAQCEYGITNINFNIKFKEEIIENKKTIITVEILNKLLEIEKKEIYKIIMVILFWTGIRIGELLALKFDDFDIKNKTLKINKSISRFKKEDILDTPKSSKSKRVIEIGTAVINAVGKLKELLYSYKNNDRLFENLCKTSIYQHLVNLGNKIGISKLGCHTFRHSHATFLFSKGVNILLISERLGHKDITTTLNIYTHILNDMKKELIKVLE